jgi:osmoprotectant transport system ATP-binding protein
MTASAASGGDVAIRLEGLTKRYPNAAQPAVDALDLVVHRGELVALVGPSGCGKTTTLKMINRLIEPTEGVIRIEGVDVRAMASHELRRGIGYVIQQMGLFPHRTIEANIATVPSLLRWDRRRIADRVRELADLVGLDHDMLRRYPDELSGGQQQRAGVARALAADPPVLLMDEPYSAVDPIVRARLQDELIALQDRLHKTVVFVTHDIDEAIKLADRIAILDVGGRLEQHDTPEELLRAPANDFVADFLGEDRGIKRLSLLTVDDVPLTEGPVVTIDTSPEAARKTMERHAVDWVAVRDREQVLGWVGAADLDGTPAIGVLPRQPFLTTFGPGTTLKAVLDGIVTSQTRFAVVVDDDDRYRGMLTVDDLAEGLNG